MKASTQFKSGLIAALLALSASAFAQTASVKVDKAWARATVQGQKGTGAFMSLTAAEGTKLVGLTSPVAGVAEVHEMKMEGDVMKMRAVAGGLDLPAGKTVELKPGGYHVMLMDLKAPLAKDSTVPMTLLFKNARGVESKLNITVPVSVTAPGAAVAGKPAAHDHKH
ncbi:MAG: copper chaperone PCu(A)C [Pseudomonadota bacterium]